MEAEAGRIKAANAAYWDANADRWRGLELPPADAVRAVGALLGCGPSSRILDAGCGSGQWSVALALAGYRVRRLDISPQMIAAARSRASDHALGEDAASFRVGDLDSTGYPDASFDAILSRAVLDFVASPGLVLEEFSRVLRPGGRLVLSVLGAASPVKRDDWRRFLPGTSTPAIRNQLLPWEAEALLEALGWEITEQAPEFQQAVSGAVNRYSSELAEQLGDRILQQSVATIWRFVAIKSAKPIRPTSPSLPPQ